jgi:hypothetical protein
LPLSLGRLTDAADAVALGAGTRVGAALGRALLRREARPVPARAARARRVREADHLEHRDWKMRGSVRYTCAKVANDNTLVVLRVTMRGPGTSVCSREFPGNKKILGLSGKSRNFSAISREIPGFPVFYPFPFSRNF